MGEGFSGSEWLQALEGMDWLIFRRSSVLASD